MKKIYILCLLAIYFSCKNESKTATTLQKEVKEIAATEKLRHKESFQHILDSVQLNGSILLYNLKEDSYYSNNFEWAKTGQLPASTYKIPNSIIGLETKEVADQNTIFTWDGEARFFKSWEADLTLKQAFARSCVPCYQEVARKVGVARMNAYIEKLKYGTILVDSTNLDNFWLRGNAKITQFQQIDFLKRLYQSKLDISKRTLAIVKDIMILKETNSYVLRGKTGWSIVDNHHNGWFVGYIETNDNVFFFATNVEPQADFMQREFQKNRKVVTYNALKQLGILLEKL